MPTTSSRAEKAPKRPLPPVRCAECRHGWALGRVCSKRPLSGELPGLKPLGCLYFERREPRDGR